MNMKPFIVLCFLFGLFLISSVATEPRKAEEATKNVEESKYVCGRCCYRGYCRRCCVTAVEAREDRNSVDETNIVCTCCGRPSGNCRRCCGKASEIPPNVEFTPQTLEAVEVRTNVDGSKATCGLCCSPVRNNACKPCCHKLGEIPANVLFDPQNAFEVKESATNTAEEHYYGGGGGYCKRRCCGPKRCWCC